MHFKEKREGVKENLLLPDTLDMDSSSFVKRFLSKARAIFSGVEHDEWIENMVLSLKKTYNIYCAVNFYPNKHW